MSLALQVEVLARTVWAESRGEGLGGQIAVAWVIMNRTRDTRRRWPRTVMEVCKQPLQFSCWNQDDPNLQKLLTVTLDVESYARAHGIACLVMSNDLRDHSKGANHYLTIEAAERVKWDDKMEMTVQLGKHRFFRG